MKGQLQRFVRYLSDLYFRFNDNSHWDQFYLYRRNLERGFSFDSFHLPSPIIEKYEKSLDWTVEFFYKYPHKCIIEPSLGYAVVGRVLLKESLWHRYVHPRLSKPNCIKYVLNSTFFSKRKLEKAIVLQFGASNYWHFYNDFLGALRLAEELKIDDQIPVLVPESLCKQSFFKQILSYTPALQKRKWVFQKKNEYYEVKTTYFLVTAHAHKKNFDYALKNIVVPEKDRNSESDSENIFVTRNSKWGRTIQNLQEIESVAEDFGFKIIDCDLLSVYQQISCFRRAKLCIGIHGASLTNIIYCENTLALLEIMPSFRINPVYYLMAKHYGYNYDCLLGKDRDLHGNFTVESQEFLRKMAMLKKAESTN